MIKDFLKYLSVALIFSLSTLILYNNYKIKTGTDLTDVQKYLKHNIVDHNINDNEFPFPVFNGKQINLTLINGKADFKNSSQISNYYLKVNSFAFPSVTFEKLLHTRKLLVTRFNRSKTFHPPKYSA